MDNRVYSKEIPLDAFFDYQLFFIVEVFLTVKSRTKSIKFAAENYTTTSKINIYFKALNAFLWHVEKLCNT